MRKDEFLAVLRKSLAALPAADLDERLDFYREVIEDSMDEGLSEEEAVAQIGSPEQVVMQILTEYAEILVEDPVADVPRVTQPQSAKRRLRTWEIVLLVVGAPIWISLAAAAFAVVVSLAAAAVAVVVSLAAAAVAVFVSVWAGLIGIAAGAVGGIGMAVIAAVKVQGAAGLALLGMALFCGGLFFLALPACTALTAALGRWLKHLFVWIKAKLTRKGEAR
ncbi:MAG: DUF1700 domain-containing protein [Clostridia bacterium]|nr:DUF1700 domain-containing protein [Clostridia bacterium]